MSTSGVVLSVDVERYGDTLTADTLATDLVLQVDDIVDFADEDDFAAGPQWLVIGDSDPMQYVSVDDDADTITLAAVVGAVYEAGEPVRVYDPTIPGPVVGHVAWIDLDEADPDDAPIPAEVTHDRMIFFGLDNLEALIGARVEIEEDPDDPEAWYVSQVIGRDPTVNPASVDTPAAALYRATDTGSLATGLWHNLTGWTADVLSGFDGLAAGWLTIRQPGRYLITSVQNWQNNTVGGRRARLQLQPADGSFKVIVSPEFRTAPDSTTGDASPTVAHSLLLEMGDEISVQVFQNSGAGLAVTGDANALRTTWHVTYLGPS